MKAMICEMCGSSELIKQGGVFVCQHCGTKYTVEEARKLMGVVKIDKTEETEKLLVLARRAREENNSANAEKYYAKVLQESPDNWEATFFQVYYQAMQCKLGEISYYADRITNVLQSVASLIHERDQVEKNQAINTIITPSCEIANLFANAAVNHYNEYSTVNGTFEECVQTVVNASVIIGAVEILVKEYCDNPDIKASVQRLYIAYLSDYKKFFRQEYLTETINRLSNEIRKVDSSFTTPTVSNGGCYVATAIYGSYDCPEVWTLRRFRDNTLAETWYGRTFIYTYYAISPTLVKWFGNSHWFKNMWKPFLDNMVNKLNEKGVENTVYDDKQW